VTLPQLEEDAVESNSVKVITDDEKTTVRIVEDGKSTDRDFQHGDYAASWAAGQRVRLGAPPS